MNNGATFFCLLKLIQVSPLAYRAHSNFCHLSFSNLQMKRMEKTPNYTRLNYLYYFV